MRHLPTFAAILLSATVGACSLPADAPLERSIFLAQQLPGDAGMKAAEVRHYARCFCGVTSRGASSDKWHEAVYVATNDRIAIYEWKSRESRYVRLVAFPIASVRTVALSASGARRQLQFELDTGLVYASMLKDGDYYLNVDATQSEFGFWRSQGVRVAEAVSFVSNFTGPMYVPVPIR